MYTSCFSLGFCDQVLKSTIGLPITRGGDAVQDVKILSFMNNEAGGYGNDLATAPAKISIVTFGKQYAPGMTPLDITLSLFDAQGVPVVGSAQNPIAHLVQMLVLPVGTACSTFATCDRVKLQPIESFLTNGAQHTTSLLRDHHVTIALKYCQIGVGQVEVRLFLTTGAELDVTGAEQSDLTSLQTSATVSCLPCVAGWERVEEFTSGFSAGLWTCARCTREQYVVDPNVHKCQTCPAGAQCIDGAFSASNPANSLWNITSSGVKRITSCPPGFVLIRDETDPTSDRCVPCAPDTYSVEEAVFGERLWDRSVENYNQYCHPCPRSRAMCGGANDVRPLAGAPLMP